jgi:hypothetical protein
MQKIGTTIRQLNNVTFVIYAIKAQRYLKFELPKREYHGRLRLKITQHFSKSFKPLNECVGKLEARTEHQHDSLRFEEFLKFHKKYIRAAVFL